MKAVILAGGMGTRISEETHLKPKPMITVGGRPILWHIMKFYSSHGIHDFIICCGYRGYMIKEYFANYFLHTSDVTFHLSTNEMEVHEKHAEPWRVTLVDTGEETMTGGRLKRVRHYIGDETFCFTYGDGLSDVNLKKLIAYHRQKKLMATVTVVKPLGRYGAFEMKDGRVLRFKEKPVGAGWVNGGYFVVEPAAIDLIKDDETSWEIETLPMIVKKNKLAAYSHDGFWQAMDTLRDRKVLEDLWDYNRAPWKIWD